MGLYVGNTKYKPIVGGVGYKVVRELPYDAEVEYLQCDGSAYIDTGLYFVSNTDKIEADVYIPKSGGRAIHGGTQNTSCVAFGFNGAGTNFLVYYGFQAKSVNASQSNAIGNKRWNTTVYNHKITVGSYSFSYNTENFTSDSTVTLIKSNNYRVYSYKQTRNGVVVADMIPVRVGTTGYMYDKVSGQLFGNAGTGSFILGNDKN